MRKVTNNDNDECAIFYLLFFCDNFMTILYLVGSFFANCNFWLFLIRFLGGYTYYKKAF